MGNEGTEPQVMKVASLDEAIEFTRRNDIENNPRMRHRDKVILRDTNRMVIWAELCEIVDEHTGELHHNTFKIVAARKTSLKLGNQVIVGNTDHKTIWLDEQKGEIATLTAFLVSANGFSGDPNDYSIVATPGQRLQSEIFQKLVGLASERDQASHLVQILDKVDENPELLRKLVEVVESNPDAAKIAAASINLARYKSAIGALEQLISENALEGAFQSLLEKHPWMFGSEYSEKIGQRNWIRDQQTDFMMRRTVDSYLELVEIKRPLAPTDRIFLYDRSHRAWYPNSELSKVVGQVVNYLDQLDAKRNDIFFDDGERVTKIRAKIIVGRDHEQDQVNALKMFNSHLHRIEVFTFDQLLATAKRVRDNLAEELRPIEYPVEEPVNDVPF